MTSPGSGSSGGMSGGGHRPASGSSGSSGPNVPGSAGGSGGSSGFGGSSARTRGAPPPPAPSPSAPAAEADVTPAAASESVQRAGVVDVPTDKDALGFEPYVAAIAEFLKADATQPPFTLSIEGSWGSGKSSFLKQLRKHLGATARVIEFNAWRHDKQDALWASFALEFIEQLERGATFWQRVAARTSLLRRRMRWRQATPRLLQLAALLLGFGVALFVAARAFRNDASRQVLLGSLAVQNGNDVLKALLGGAATGGGVVGLLALSWLVVRKAREVLGNPLSIELRDYLERPDYDGRLTFAEQFHRDFSHIVEAYASGGRVYVFIDDLDRCEIPKAADLMQALHVLLASESRHLVFVLALDRDVVAAAIAAKYDALIPYLTALNPAASGTLDAMQRAQAGLDYGHDFLEKLIQLPFRVPEPAESSVQSLLDSLSFQKKPAPPPAAVERAVVDVVEGAESDRLREIVATMAHPLGDNPRRIKQFIGMYRLQVYIGATTGLLGAAADPAGPPNGFITFEQLAKFVVLSLRWPRLIADVEVDRELLRDLQRAAWNPTAIKRSAVARWVVEPELCDVMLVGAESAEGGGLYRLDTVDVSALLRIAPPRPPRPERRTGGEGAPDSRSQGAAGPPPEDLYKTAYSAP